jgi:FkbM family methyltransferase
MSDHLSYESLLQAFYTEILSEGDFAIDVGAHSGRHTLPMLKSVVSKTGKSGRVFAFEPIPFAREWLKSRFWSEKVSMEPLSLLPYALSNYSGSSEFVVAVDRPEESGLKERVFNGRTEIREIEVEVRRLDEFDFGGLVRFIKIDCEGGEFNVLLGGSEVIGRCRPTITFEFGASSFRAYDVVPETVFDWFSQLKYLVFDITGKSLSAGEFVESCRTEAVWDYLAIPVERERDIAVLTR